MIDYEKIIKFVIFLVVTYLVYKTGLFYWAYEKLERLFFRGKQLVSHNKAYQKDILKRQKYINKVIKKSINQEV